MTMLSARERAVLAMPASEAHARSEKAGEGASKLRLRITWEEVAAAVSANSGRHGPARASETRDLRDRANASSPSGPCDGARREEGEGRRYLRPSPRRLQDPRSQGRAAAARRAPGLAIARRVPASTGSPRKKRQAGGRRWRLARRAENPLTARVIVNRLWQHHFGRGIVATPSDFGVRGEPPSHPELLDWLASELIRQGWRFKPLHRLMVTSATYRQSSKPARSSPPTIPRTRSSAG